MMATSGGVFPNSGMVVNDVKKTSTPALVNGPASIEGIVL